MKKYLSLILALVLTFSLAACGAKEEAPAAKEETKTEAPAAKPEAPAAKEEAPEETPITISIAHEALPGEGRDVACEEWKRLVEERSNGSITFNLYNNEQLGAKGDLMEQILMGEPIILNCDGSFLCEYGAPEIAIMSMPYVFDSWDQVAKLVESDWFAQQEELLAAAGLHVVNATWALGERQLVTTKPVTKLADMKGLKIRVPANNMSVLEFECFGATSTPMPLSEVYSAVQQGIIDGQENPIDYLYNAGYGEICDYVTLTGHVKMPVQWIMSEEVWQSLSPNQQKIITEAALEVGKINDEIALGSEAEYADKFRADGVTVTVLDEATLQEFKDAVVPLYSHPDIIGGWSNPNLYQEIREYLAS